MKGDLVREWEIFLVDILKGIEAQKIRNTYPDFSVSVSGHTHTHTYTLK